MPMMKLEKEKVKPMKSTLFISKPKRQALLTISSFKLPEKKQVFEKVPVQETKLPEIPKATPQVILEKPKTVEVIPEENETEKYTNKFSGNIPDFAPITTTSIDKMFANINYIDKKAETNKEDNEIKIVENEITEEKNTQTEKKQEKKSKMKKEIKKIIERPKPQKTESPPVVKKQRIARKAQEPRRDSAPGPIIQDVKIEPVNDVQIAEKAKKIEEPQTTPKQPVKENDNQILPDPEKYNQPLVHTYSIAKALPVYRKTKILSESEKFYEDKYSKDNIASSIPSAVHRNKARGFRSNGLPIGELFKNKILASHSRGNSLIKTNYNTPNNFDKTLFTHESAIEIVNGLSKNLSKGGKSSQPEVDDVIIKDPTAYLLEAAQKRNSLDIKQYKKLAAASTQTGFIKPGEYECIKLPEIIKWKEEADKLVAKCKVKEASSGHYVLENNRLINLLLSEEPQENSKTGKEENPSRVMDAEYYSDLEKIEEEDSKEIVAKFKESAMQLAGGKSAQVIILYKLY